MSHLLNPEIVARDIANAVCQKYVSSLDADSLEDSDILKEAFLIYANAYDVIYEQTCNSNSQITEDQ